MTLDQAVTIRSRQLQGQWVHQAALDEALRVIRNGAPPPAEPQPTLATPRSRTPRWAGRARGDSQSAQMLRLIEDEPMERGAFREAVDKAGVQKSAVSRLFERGWAEYIVRITDKGREAL